jgi:CheY-like chemotaxis protein
VTLKLPAAASVPAPSDALAWNGIVGYRGARRSILVVDDNADNRAVLRDLLVPLGFDLLESESGEQALRLCSERRLSAIVMDLAMPGLDGYESTRRIRQMPELASTVIIASSASMSDAERQKSLSAGCNDFLPKPVQAGLLLEKLQKHLYLEWVLRDKSAPPVASSAHGAIAEEVIVPPPTEALARLLAMARKGRISEILDETRRMEQGDPRHWPWMERVRALAKSCDLEKLRHFLQATNTEAAGARPAGL